MLNLLIPIEATPKQSWEEKFSQFTNEADEKSLNPIVNNEGKL